MKVLLWSLTTNKPACLTRSLARDKNITEKTSLCTYAAPKKKKKSLSQEIPKCELGKQKLESKLDSGACTKSNRAMIFPITFLVFEVNPSKQKRQSGFIHVLVNKTKLRTAASEAKAVGMKSLPGCQGVSVLVFFSSIANWHRSKCLCSFFSVNVRKWCSTLKYEATQFIELKECEHF